VSEMSDEEIREKLRKIEALFSRPGFEGERQAARAAAERMRQRLGDAERAEQNLIEMRFSLSSQWSRRLLVALCRRYGYEPFRYSRQRYTTVMLKAPEDFIHETLWPHFQKLDEALSEYLSEITDRLIKDEIFAGTGDVEEVVEPRRLPGKQEPL